MSQTGETSASVLRVAIVGAGPSAFYAADHLLRQEGVAVEVDMFDRLPTPYGLVRNGVAPDHQKIKTVTKTFAQTAADPRFRFFGMVEIGAHVTVEELRRHYHQVLFATGAQTDRRMDIPGEDLRGSHAATEFVAWYNGHPDYRDRTFDLSHECVVIVGVGNVAVDVARILCMSPEELRATDMADYAIEALCKSAVCDVYLLGRRGPAQAAFTNPEVKELGELADCDVVVLPEEAALDELSRQAIEQSGDRTTQKKVELIEQYAARAPAGRRRRLHLRFLESPVEVLGEDGCVRGVRIVHNVLKQTEMGTLVPEATGSFETLPAGLVFRSVGYRGVPVPGVPFHERWGVILNEKGRVLDPESQDALAGLYVTGWIKRGPSGVIGTNKPDSVETVTAMLEDVAAGKTLEPAEPAAEAALALIRERQPEFFSFEDWQRLDEIERARGEAEGRPRVKFTRVAEMLAALGRG